NQEVLGNLVPRARRAAVPAPFPALPRDHRRSSPNNLEYIVSDRSSLGRWRQGGVSSTVCGLSDCSPRGVTSRGPSLAIISVALGAELSSVAGAKKPMDRPAKG